MISTATEADGPQILNITSRIDIFTQQEVDSVEEIWSEDLTYGSPPDGYHLLVYRDGEKVLGFTCFGIRCGQDILCSRKGHLPTEPEFYELGTQVEIRSLPESFIPFADRIDSLAGFSTIWKQDCIFGNFMSGLTYNLHQSGKLIELERKWGIKPTQYLDDQRQRFSDWLAK